MAMPDTGNPNFYSIFAGRGEVELEDGATSTGNAVMLTLTNELQFMGDYAVGESGVAGMLPEGFRPNAEIVFPALCGEDIAKVTISDDGTIMGNPNSTLHLNGLVVNLSANWYA